MLTMETDDVETLYYNVTNNIIGGMEKCIPKSFVRTRKYDLTNNGKYAVSDKEKN